VQFLWPLIVANSPKWYPVSILVAGLSAANSYTTIDQVITAYFLASIPLVIIYIFLQRYIIQGVSMTGIKG
jgi:multiple sugar transport system permease protein